MDIDDEDESNPFDQPPDSEDDDIPALDESSDEDERGLSDKKLRAREDRG